MKEIITKDRNTIKFQNFQIKEKYCFKIFVILLGLGNQIFSNYIKLFKAIMIPTSASWIEL